MAIPADTAFALFQPEGERRWAAGWSPRYLFAQGPGQGEGTVFTTTSGEKTAVWIVTANDPATRYVAYAYILPGVRATQVDVHVTRAGPRRSRASVRYRMTSLSEAADEHVAEFARDYEAFLAHWQDAIDAHVVKGVPLPGG